MNLSGIDLNLLVALDALLTDRNVSRAAARVGRSQPAMSNALRRLRVLFDDPLFIHTRQGMSPTPRCQAVSTYIQNALDSVRQSLRPTPAFDPATSKRKFRIATTDYGETIILPALIKKLAAIAPKITFHLSPIGKTDGQSGMQTGDIDLAINWRIEEQPFDAHGFYTTLLCEEHLVCVVRANNLRVRRHLTLKQFVDLDHIVIAPTETYNPIVDIVLAQHRLKRRTAVFGNNFLTAPFIVARTDMIATVASRVAQIFSKSLGLRILKPPIKLPPLKVRLVWHERSRRDSGHQWLRAILTTVASEL